MVFSYAQNCKSFNTSRKLSYKKCKHQVNEQVFLTHHRATLLSYLSAIVIARKKPRLGRGIENRVYRKAKTVS